MSSIPSDAKLNESSIFRTPLVEPDSYKDGVPVYKIYPVPCTTPKELTLVFMDLPADAMTAAVLAYYMIPNFPNVVCIPPIQQGNKDALQSFDSFFKTSKDVLLIGTYWNDLIPTLMDVYPNATFIVWDHKTIYKQGSLHSTLVDRMDYAMIYSNLQTHPYKERHDYAIKQTEVVRKAIFNLTDTKGKVEEGQAFVTGLLQEESVKGTSSIYDKLDHLFQLTESDTKFVW